MPGRGSAGAPGDGGRCVSFATISGRGGTIGRATGCPARFGFAGGRSGLPPPIGPAYCGAAGAAGRAAPGAGRAGVGAGRGAPGIATDGGVFGISPIPAGSGWRGPERICPGFGAGALGTGFAGIAAPRDTGGTTALGVPPAAKGGRSGLIAGRAGAAGCSGDSLGCSGACLGCSGCAAGSTRAAGAGRGAGGSIATGAASTTVGGGGGAEGAASACAPPDPFELSPEPVNRRRTSSAMSSSSELELVFLSTTPSSGRRSIITLGLTSSSRASSLMRILLIR